MAGDVIFIDYARLGLNICFLPSDMKNITPDLCQRLTHGIISTNNLGDPAPLFNLLDVQGSSMNLASHPKPVALVFIVRP